MNNNNNSRKPNNGSNANSKQTLLVLDRLDIRIIKELLNNGDVSSQQVAKKLGTPLSTVQRRKTRLERSVLKRDYELKTRDLGWRFAELLMLVGNGRTDEFAKELAGRFDNIIRMSVRINTKSNLAAYIGFRNSDELHTLMEKIRASPEVSNLEWSEIVSETEDRNVRLAHLLFNSI